MRRAGLPEALIAETTLANSGEQTEDADAIGIWPDNWDIVTAFIAINSQWRAILIGKQLHYLGLDYTAVRARLEGQFTLTPQLWDGIQIMEAEVRAVMNRG